MSRRRVLMAVFNGLEFDGRVQRAASALSPIADVHVLALCGAEEVWRPPDGAYTSEGVPGPMMGVRAQRAFGRRLQELAEERRPSVIYAHDYYLALAGARLRSKGLPFVYDAHELLKPVRGQRRSMRDRWFQATERIGARRADLVICANEPRARLFQTYAGLRAVPTVVRNIPDEAQEPPLPNVRRDPGLVLYQGDVSKGRRLDLLLETLPLLDPEVRLTVAGGGPALDTLRRMAASFGWEDRVTFLGRIPRADLPRIMAESGVGVLSYPAPDLNNVYCAPNKVYEYARAALPMVGIGSEHLRSLVEGPGLGVSLEATAGPEQLADAIRRTMGRRAEHEEACRAFAAVHTWETEASRLRQAVQGLLEGADG